MELRQQLIISENKSILASVAGVQVSQPEVAIYYEYVRRILSQLGEFCQATGARKYR